MDPHLRILSLIEHDRDHVDPQEIRRQPHRVSVKVGGQLRQP